MYAAFCRRWAATAMRRAIAAIATSSAIPLFNPLQVVAVDHSLLPPSYGIHLDSAEGGEVRETEGSRLQPLPPPEPAS